MGSTSPDLAVEEWILTFPATQELDKNLIWFRPMLNRIAMRLLADVAWGARYRLYLGAIISLLDIYTDIDAIVRFFEEGNAHFAYANIAFVAVSLVIQLILVYVQNMKRGWKVIAYEELIVICMHRQNTHSLHCRHHLTL